MLKFDDSDGGDNDDDEWFTGHYTLWFTMLAEH